jgi:lysozyme family protein
MTDLNALQRANDARWKIAKITGRLNFDAVARKAFANRARYIDIVRRCRARGSNMPDEAWVFVAVIHNRESGMDFTTHLGQGDPLNRATTHVPAGRGPFFGMDAFERGAVDALVDCAPKAAIANKDWSISGMLTYLERYNGLKYANAGRPSPYLWSAPRSMTRRPVPAARSRSTMARSKTSSTSSSASRAACSRSTRSMTRSTSATAGSSAAAGAAGAGQDPDRRRRRRGLAAGLAQQARLHAAAFGRRHHRRRHAHGDRAFQDQQGPSGRRHRGAGDDRGDQARARAAPVAPAIRNRCRKSNCRRPAR